MKCIKKDGKFSKVPEHIAETRVKKDGWFYCPKSEFKKSTDKEVINKPQAASRPKSTKIKKSKKQVEDQMDDVDKLINKKD